MRHGADSADARSLVDLLQLGLTAKARVVFSASGSEAPAALAKFLAVVNGLTAQERSAAQAQAPSVAPGRTWQPVTALAAVTGVAASAGLAVGVRRLASADAQVPDRPAPLLNGKALLEAALAAARQETQALADATAKRLGAPMPRSSRPRPACSTTSA
ncbi:HPr family phosphocarrier protein [Achromobacter xylosoxidans]